MAKTCIQIRAEEEDKIQAGEILEQLGTNISTVFNMLLKQIIITHSIPFEIKLGDVYSENEAIKKVKATMSIENMDLTDEDIRLLKSYRTNKTSREILRKNLILQYQEHSDE